MVGRLATAADFQRLLAAPSRSRSAHFALHHLQSRPGAGADTTVHHSSTELSTESDPPRDGLVDKLPESSWLGIVIPKRHARRAVTRNLIRRQVRAVLQSSGRPLPRGMWLVRLRLPFDRREFVSAASDALRHAARLELEGLFAKAMRPAAPVRRDPAA